MPGLSVSMTTDSMSQFLLTASAHEELVVILKIPAVLYTPPRLGTLINPQADERRNGRPPAPLMATRCTALRTRGKGRTEKDTL